jgi:two-component system response regulator HydG
MREIKRDVPEMPVVVMSGYPTPETISEVLKSGAIQFIPKPFRPDELIKTIHKAIQKIPSKKSFPTGAG